MTARMRRLASDYEEIKKNFAGHKNIIVTPIGGEPPEKYHVTYFVNGIYLLPDGRIETLGRHEVEITLHADYPRYKPICKILTPIWHPNFRDGQICIGDIWGAGESLSDIIINIGDMIQYKSWNSYSPLSADAAKWAMENKHLFPVGNINLHVADYASSKESVEIDLFDEEGKAVDSDEPVSTAAKQENDNGVTAVSEKTDENGNTYIDRSDFITGSGTMMIASDDEDTKQRAWEFMKWWASSDTQVRFGREIEALLGSSARYATANINAFSQLAWTADDIEVLTEQWRQTVGIREIPGGYYTGRHITNAVRKVINDQEDPRETIIDYTITINEEIAKKRSEFGLPLE